MPTFLTAAFFGILALIAVLFFRYARLKQRYALPKTSGAPLKPLPETDIDGFAGRLARMIRIPTVSWTDRDKRDVDAFVRFRELLAALYPEVHGAMDMEVVNDFALVYRWKGKETGKKPVLFLAHFDVVPAGEEGDETWEEPPFSGLVKDGVLWGRGTLDIKSQLAFQLETAETLLARGWQPDRDIYFAFGGDEEIAGTQGAGTIAALFRERGLHFEFVLDEGGVIAKDQLAFLKGRPAALVGLAEKGFVTVKITAAGESGHSSMPVKGGTAIERLAGGIMRLKKRPFPARLAPEIAEMLERFVPHVALPLGLIFSNLWLTRPLIQRVFSKDRVTDSLIRTTQAVTVCRSGEQENVLPGEAVCLVNHRIMPGDTIDGILERHRQTLGDDGLALADAGNWPANNPVRSGDTTGSGFVLIRDILAHTHPGTIPVPYLVNGSTDSKYYAGLADQILRFTPLEMTPADIASVHGINEKVSLDNLAGGLEFYIRLFQHL